jgi:2'-5' RNA ligase
MHRLFVALRPPPAIRHRLAAVMAGVPGARWQDDDQLHLTLRFIGAVDRPVAEDAVAALAQVHGVAAEVTLAGVGAFDRKGRTDAIWAGVMPHDALAALHRKVDRAFVRIGLEPARRAYLPHITLARLSRNAAAEPHVARFLADHTCLTSEPFTLDHLILFESHLGHEAARYEPIARWPLARS